MKVILSFVLVLATVVSLSNNLDSNAYAQNDPNLIPWDENRLLKFSDFQGVSNTFPDDYTGDRSDSFGAFTYTKPYTNWMWQITQNQPCTYTITAFDDNAYFDKTRSWVKSEHASDMYLLNHEQKHFDITEIHSRKANELVANDFFGKQFVCPSLNGQSQNDAINQKISQDLQPVFNQISQEMNQMNIDYDAQTNHSANNQMQKEWDDYVANALNYYAPYKDKQEIQLAQETKQSTLTCPPDHPYLHSDGQCWNVPDESQTTSSIKKITTESVFGTLQINSPVVSSSKYSPGIVQVSGKVASYLRGTPLTLEIKKPDNSVETQGIIVNRDGNFGAPVVIKNNWPEGSYTVTAIYGTNEIGTVNFQVVGYTTQTKETTTELLTYENKQYGFSIKYPSTWQKNEILEKDNDKPNRTTIVTFTHPSQTALYVIGFTENDLTYRGLDDQQILNKMKKEITDECSECKDIKFVAAETTAHTNGYKTYYAGLTTTMLTDKGTLSPLLGYGFIPDGNDMWLIAVVFFSQDNFEQISDEITQIGESFTIFDYKGTPQTGSDLDKLNEEGMDLLHSKKYAEAISVFDEIIDKDPNDIYAYANKGLALEKLKKHDEALEYFDKALEIDPTFVVALYDKGLLLGNLERYREAIPYLDRVLAIEPDNVDALDEKGQSLASLGSHKEALEYFDKALAIEPENPIVLFDKGFSLANMGRYNEAISYYDLVLEQDPKDAITLNNKGYALYRLGEYDEALAYLNNALEIDPSFTLAQENKELVLKEISEKKPEEISEKTSETPKPSDKGGGCLIATATYGSELAPQVQQLRELRDNHLLQTQYGTSFMSSFNQFYYSFSPTIADWERESPAFKEDVKIILTPMISSLSILNYVDMDSESEVLGYGISLIILNIGMYFVAPAIVIHTIRKKI